MTARERIERLRREAEELRDLLRTGELPPAGAAESLRIELGALAYTVSEAIHALRSVD